MALYQGYIGFADIDGEIVRCTDFSITPNQEPLFYDHAIGLNDDFITNPEKTKGEKVGTIQIQKTLWRPGTVNIQGGISFPATQDSASLLFDYAKTGNYIDELFFKHNCKSAQKFKHCRVNTYTFSIMAGEWVNITADIVAMDMEEDSKTDLFHTPQKFITWDKVDIDPDGGIDKTLINGFNFTINNNIQPMYTANPLKNSRGDTMSNKLFPMDLRIGMQEVKGDIVVYNKYGLEFLTPASSFNTIGVSCPGFSTDIKVIYKPTQMPGQIGPIISTIGFVGVDRPFGA